jgi:hypothetical protein
MRVATRAERFATGQGREAAAHLASAQPAVYWQEAWTSRKEVDSERPGSRAGSCRSPFQSGALIPQILNSLAQAPRRGGAVGRGLQPDDAAVVDSNGGRVPAGSARLAPPARQARTTTDPRRRGRSRRPLGLSREPRLAGHRNMRPRRKPRWRPQSAERRVDWFSVRSQRQESYRSLVKNGRLSNLP